MAIPIYTQVIMSNIITTGKNSNRQIDANGFMHVSDCVLTEAVVSPYLGSEIQNYHRLGMKPDVIYNILRPIEEITKAKDTFGNLQLLDKHTEVDSKDPKRELTIGTTGTDIRIDEGKMLGTVTVWIQKAIDQIAIADKNPNQGKKDLSCGYTYDLVVEVGQYNGMDYSHKMVNIAGNHVALVPDGRVPNAMIADNNFLEGDSMATAKSKIDSIDVLNKVRKIVADGDRDPSDSLDDVVKAVSELEGMQKNLGVKSAVDEQKPKDNEKTENAEDKGVADASSECVKPNMDAEMSEDEELEDAKLSLKEYNDARKKSGKKALSKDAYDKLFSKKDEKKSASDAMFMDENAVKQFAADAVKTALGEYSRISSKVTTVLGKISAMDSSAEEMLNKALKIKGLNYDGRSFEVKEAMLDTLLATTVSSKPKRIAQDSNTVSSTYKPIFFSKE